MSWLLVWGAKGFLSAISYQPSAELELDEDGDLDDDLGA